MAEFGPILKKEIKKLARREAKLLVQDLSAQVKAANATVRKLATVVGQQEKQIAALSGKVASASKVQSVAVAKAPAAATPGWRINTVSALRKRHHLSQNALAKLIGVGLNTVWLWENGRTVPRVKQREALLALRGVSQDELKKRLAAVGLKTGKSKPGRKPGSKNKPKAAVNPAAKRKKKAAKRGAKKATKRVARKATKRTSTRKKTVRRKK